MPRDDAQDQQTGEGQKEGRLARGLRVARGLKDDPRQVVPLVRTAMLDIWRSRGGGFYGLGYLIAFVVLEISVVVDDVMGASGVADFALGRALELVFRLGFLSFINVFQALVWPVFVLELLGGPGIIVLIGSYLAFEYALKPGIERLFPELAEHRAGVVARKLATKARKKAAREARRKTRRSGGTASQPRDQ